MLYPCQGARATDDTAEEASFCENSLSMSPQQTAPDEWVEQIPAFVLETPKEKDRETIEAWSACAIGWTISASPTVPQQIALPSAAVIAQE